MRKPSRRRADRAPGWCRAGEGSAWRWNLPGLSIFRTKAAFHANWPVGVLNNSLLLRYNDNTIVAGAQTERRGGAGPVRGLLGGKTSPTAFPIASFRAATVRERSASPLPYGRGSVLSSRTPFISCHSPLSTSGAGPRRGDPVGHELPPARHAPLPLRRPSDPAEAPWLRALPGRRSLTIGSGQGYT
jgi:hypothetical protein